LLPDIGNVKGGGTASNAHAAILKAGQRDVSTVHLGGGQGQPLPGPVRQAHLARQAVQRRRGRRSGRSAMVYDSFCLGLLLLALKIIRSIAGNSHDFG
jgi:hypothetical protein